MSYLLLDINEKSAELIEKIYKVINAKIWKKYMTSLEENLALGTVTTSGGKTVAGTCGRIPYTANGAQ